MQMATWSPGCTPTERSKRLRPIGRGVELGERSDVKPEPAMMSAGLSGWVSTNAPGYMSAKVADCDQRHGRPAGPPTVPLR